jgi:hypothetical protein
MLWFRQDIVNSNAEIIQYGSLSGAGSRYAPFIIDNTLYIEGNGINTNMAATADTRWHHYSANLAGTTFNTTQMYYDGAPQTTGYVNGGFTVNTDNYIRIASLAGTLYFNGNIDDIRIYNRALTAGEVKAIYDDSVSMRYEAINHRGYDDTVFKAPIASGGLIMPRNRSIIYGGGMGL